MDSSKKQPKQPNKNPKKYEMEKSNNIQCYNNNNNRRGNILKQLQKLQKDNSKLREENIKLEEVCYNVTEGFCTQNDFVKQNISDNLKIKNM